MTRTGRPQQMNRKELYEWIMMLGFCAFDMALYLDTHPHDKEALDYFNQCNELYHNAKSAYEEEFEPLTMLPGQHLDSWDWNSGHMPWEGGR